MYVIKRGGYFLSKQKGELFFHKDIDDIKKSWLFDNFESAYKFAVDNGFFTDEQMDSFGGVEIHLVMVKVD